MSTKLLVQKISGSKEVCSKKIWSTKLSRPKIGTNGKKVDKMSLFFKVRKWYGQIKAKIYIILSPPILS